MSLHTRKHAMLLPFLLLRSSSAFLVQKQRTSVNRIRNNWISIDDALDLPDSTSTRFVDGTWYHKGDRNGQTDFLTGPRIPGAVYFDLTQFSTTSQQLHAQPTVEQFETLMTSWSVHKNDTIILYASSPLCYFLPRVWFTFRHVMGHEETYMLKGTLEDWIQAGKPVDDRTLDVSLMGKEKAATEIPYKVVAHNPSVLIDLEEMKRVVANKEAIILDARGSSFAKVGHMPGALHVPYESLHNSYEKNRFKSPDELRQILDPVIDSGDGTGDVVLTCGSGVSACSLYLALDEAGYQGRARVYDGSWYEWSSQEDTPKIVPTKQKSL